MPFDIIDQDVVILEGTKSFKGRILSGDDIVGVGGSAYAVSLEGGEYTVLLFDHETRSWHWPHGEVEVFTMQPKK
jgi:hypothetical protein